MEAESIGNFPVESEPGLTAEVDDRVALGEAGDGARACTFVAVRASEDSNGTDADRAKNYRKILGGEEAEGGVAELELVVAVAGVGEAGVGVVQEVGKVGIVCSGAEVAGAESEEGDRAWVELGVETELGVVAEGEVGVGIAGVGDAVAGVEVGGVGEAGLEAEDGLAVEFGGG